MSLLVKSQAFMAHIPHADISGIVQELLQDIRPGSKYLIACENKPYEHIHFLVEMSDVTYSKFAKRIFIDRYKLRGRAVKGLPRQYGKLNKLENLERMKIYMLKGLKDPGNKYIYNLEQSYIDKLYEQSFKKRLTPCQKFKEHLILWYHTKNKNHNHDYIELSTLVRAWVCINEKQPPIAKTLVWLAVEAGMITLDEYIRSYYGDGICTFSLAPSVWTQKNNLDKQKKLSLLEWQVEHSEALIESSS